MVVADGVATVTIDHPPLNLADATLLPSLRGFVARVRDVGDLAGRIAGLRPEIIAAVKAAAGAAPAPVTQAGLAVENEALTGLFTAEAATLAQKQPAAGAQTRDGNGGSRRSCTPPADRAGGVRGGAAAVR